MLWDAISIRKESPRVMRRKSSNRAGLGARSLGLRG